MARLSRFVPRLVRHGLSARLAQLRAARLEADLETLAAGRETIVAGPWLGEVGFELLYWVPFLAWFAERFAVAPERLLVVSRGGTAAWYRPFAGGYRDILAAISPARFRELHDARVVAHGEQKQRRVLAFEHELLQQLAGDVQPRRMLHPSTMYRLFNPYWWGHVDEGWVLRRTRYRRLTAPPLPPGAVPDRPYVAAKFYFNDCFPATAEHRAFVRATLARLVEDGPVVSLSTGLALDDHGGVDVRELGVHPLPPELAAHENLAVQSAIVAGASAFVGTYGGFSYLAPFYGVRSTAYYGDPSGYSPRHLTLARSAFRLVGADGFLDVRALADARRPVTHS